MLSFEISHLSSTTSIEEVICRQRHQYFRHLVSSWACSSVIKRNFEAKLYIKLSKGAKIRNRYNQVPHLTRDTNGKVTNSQIDATNESQLTNFSPKRLFCVLKRNVSMRRLFEKTKHTSARKIAIHSKTHYFFRQSICSVGSKETSLQDRKNIKDPQKKNRLGTVSKIFYWRA